MVMPVQYRVCVWRCHVVPLMLAEGGVLHLSHVRAHRCRCAISRVERIPAQQLYISAATLQAFKCELNCSRHICLCTQTCSALAHACCYPIAAAEVELVEHAQHAGQHLRHQCTF